MRRLLIATFAALIAWTPAAAQFDGGPGSRARAGSVGNARIRGTPIAMVRIAEVVTSGSQASVTISSIPSTYRDIRVVVNGRSTASALNADVYMQLNGDTGGNYDFQLFLVNNATLASSASVAQTQADIGWLGAGTGPANLSGTADVTIYNYAGSTFSKNWGGQSQLIRQGTTAASTFGGVFQGDWRSTAAITSVKVFPSSGNFVDGSVVTVYGIGSN